MEQERTTQSPKGRAVQHGPLNWPITKRVLTWFQKNEEHDAQWMDGETNTTGLQSPQEIATYN